MSDVTIRLGDDDMLIDVDGQCYVIPVGAGTLTRTELVSDPPRPEELTNSIGIVADHLDDVVRALPGVAEADDVSIVGELATAVAAVEYGGDPPLPFRLYRAAAEDVFRTMATEASAERALNPGLPDDAVHTIVAACCIVVAAMRYLHLDHVHIAEQIDARTLP